MSSTRQVRVVKTSSRPINYSSRPVAVSRTVTSRPAISRRVVTTNYPSSSYTSYSTPGVVERTIRTSTRDPVHITPRDTSTLTQTRTNEMLTTNPPSFGDMQKTMENQLEDRRSKWEKEVEQMQQDFFNVKTSDPKEDADADADANDRTVALTSSAPRSGSEILEIGNCKELFHDPGDGTRVYRKRFDLSGFDQNDLSVRAENNKLYITANREEEFGGSKSTRQFKRTVDIPDAVDPDHISSSLNEDGILTIEAPVDESRIQQKQQEAESQQMPAIVSREHIDPAFSNFGAFSPGFGGHVVHSSYSSGGQPEVTTYSTSSSSSSSANPRRFRCPEVEETPNGPKLKTDLYLGRKYKADDVTIKVYQTKITVEAKSEDVVGGRTAKRQFSRDVSLPEAVERDTFRAMLGEDGKVYLGGSFVTNTEHDAILQSVLNDMPPSGSDCNIIF